ncbi:FtsB family cell division protein [Microbacterium sp. Clip185]|uniref:FtsB family cell division protein n=1 Tax=Microbacterium sp. Clip185 TaxID=3025663 RepID=UPI0023657BB4|nr:septum formation initiator family protein [Microbacterium sp. Clip185]WDG17048.1 septum formation initiator family protein [Microbacterium sp. Clip185]
MAARTAPPSRSRRSSDAPRRRVDVRDWLGGIRLSGFMIIMLGLVVLGVLVLVPTVGTYLDQQQRIAALKNSVQLTESQIADLQAQSERWDDPAYITTQARERLYYMNPGEIAYIVDNDLTEAQQPREQDAVSDQVQQTRTDWMAQLVGSVVTAGAAKTAVADPTAPADGGTPATPAP